MADGRFDDLLMGIASKHKNVEDLSYSILSFFERRTDLFHIMERPDERMGFGPGVAEKMTAKHFKHFQQRYFARCQPHLLYEPDSEAATAAERSAISDAPAGDSGGTGDSGGSAADAGDGPTASSSSSSAAAAAPEAAPATESAVPEQTRKMMRHISTWNGAVTDNYFWSQSISEVTVEIEVETGCTSKDIKAELTPTRLTIRCKGNTVLEGKLHEKVSVDDFIWYLDDNKIVLTMEKQRQTWWKCVLEGDEEIDTTKVESTRTIDEYDGETQGAIRKIMFDQSQKAIGQATSDQIRTADMMKEAWNAPGSPFRGSEFDPTLLNLSGPVPDDFFQDLEKRRIEEARAKKAAAAGQ